MTSPTPFLRMPVAAIPNPTKPLVGLKVDHRNGDCFVGSVWGHPTYPNGHTIITSPLRSMQNGIIETAGYRYQVL